MLAGGRMEIVVPRSATLTAAPPTFVTGPVPHPAMANETVAAEAAGLLSAGSATESAAEAPPTIDPGLTATALDARAGAGTICSAPVAVTEAAVPGWLETVSVYVYAF